eukprot:CAMPEP_0195288774 /NCGR_PEP_ID=MMETSP0707-20130614/5299_1 /TAXON_ID=33640 /ORGANISM="Asterionellopsis glacialis, Strain CCMP134" /LENGTH=506 /DNA_ID=CAMNT_0040348677 /DNA_START=289 /DNA_END=1810 /DNA_ORIENTATION=+
MCFYGSIAQTVPFVSGKLKERRTTKSTVKRRRRCRQQQQSPQSQTSPPHYEDVVVSALSYQDGTSSHDDSSLPPTTTPTSTDSSTTTTNNNNNKGHDNSIICSSSSSISTTHQEVVPQQPPHPTTNPQEEQQQQQEMEGSPPSFFQIWKLYGSSLFQLCRPSNFAGVIVFHILGTHLALLSTATTSNAAAAAAAAATTKSSYSVWHLVFQQPSMWNTLFILLGITSTSMMVNDYYDTKLGVDAARLDRPLQQPSPPPIPSLQTSPLTLPTPPTPTLPLWVVKKCLVCAYALLLPAISFMPSVLGRTTATLSVMFTFWYTKHLKPKTWIKNITCACIMALAPLTSGSVAAFLANNGATNSGFLSLLFASPHHIGGITQLGQLVLLLFFGFMGREITMDCQDVHDDAQHHIQTIPVQYGTKFASQIALGCYTLMAMVTVGCKVAADGRGRQQGWLPPLVQCGFATIGSLRMLQRAWQVYRTQGTNTHINAIAIDEGKTTMLLLLASFI